MYTRLWVCECVSVWPRQLDVSYNVRGSTFLHGIETCEAPRLAVNQPTDTHTHTYDNYRMPHMCATSAACRDRTRVRVRDQSRKWIFRFHVVTICFSKFPFCGEFREASWFLLELLFDVRNWSFAASRGPTVDNSCTGAHQQKTVHVLTKPVKRDKPTGFTFFLRFFGNKSVYRK